jgi:hypothetical protein
MLCKLALELAQIIKSENGLELSVASQGPAIVAGGTQDRSANFLVRCTCPYQATGYVWLYEGVLNPSTADWKSALHMSRDPQSWRVGMRPGDTPTPIEQRRTNENGARSSTPPTPSQITK